jgi:hypothetical protein
MYIVKHCTLHDCFVLLTEWFRTTSLTTTKGKQKVVTRTPAFRMEDFLKGRTDVEAYTVFFEHFVPCAVGKTEWERCIGEAGTITESKDSFLSTVSDEAFALLLLENSYERWFDLYTSNDGNVMQQRGVKQRRFESDVPTLYTRGGIKYDKYLSKEGERKGWSDEGIIRFNELFKLVKKDRKDNSNFDVDWLEARKTKQAAKNAGVSKRKRTRVSATSELFAEEE